MNTIACKRLFSLGCVPHTDGAVLQHPTWSAEKAFVEAGKRWDAASQTFIEATLATLHTLRPKGRFGLFGYPDCDGRISAEGSPNGCPSVCALAQITYLSQL